MKKIGLLAAASFAALSVGAAVAADLPSRKAAPAYMPPPPPPPLWTGFYAGLNLGGGWTANKVNAASLTPYSDVAGNLYFLPGNTQGGSNAGGVVGGGQIGYNFQIGPSFVVGVETDIQGTSMRSGGNSNTILYPDPVLPGSFLIPLSPAGNPGIALNWFGTVRGRAGFLFTPTLLLYGTAGFAYGGVSGGYSNFSSTRTGWTAGGGVEWMFLPNWSAKGEYLFTDLSSGGNTGAWGFSAGYHHHPQFNTVRAGVNYHFNWGAAAAPAVASY
ncbi:MAG: outer membrane protein [Methylocystis sp.]|uniref:outer membrane protein n=1 Tax=Methylocystis sp. TaxID=1911079 RepID=UPI003DA3B382